MGRREELLAGITSLNKEEFDAREDSEEAQTIVGAGVAAESDQREPRAPGDAGPRGTSDAGDLQANETSLEDLLRAEVVGKYATRDEIQSQISGCKDRLRALDVVYNKLCTEIDILEGVLNENYRRDGSSESPVPDEEPSGEVTTEENS